MGRGKDLNSICSSGTATDIVDRSQQSVCPESGSKNRTSSKASLWPGFFASTFSIFEHHNESSVSEKKTVQSRHNGWTTTVRKIMTSGSMRRIHERILGSRKSGVYSSGGDIWLLGVCHKISQDLASDDAVTSNSVATYELDFSSRILMTYRKGFMKCALF